MKTTIKVSQEVIDKCAKENRKIYLSDVIDEFPSNCIFLKGATGIGGTTLALRDEKPTIVSMPFVNAVKSKIHDGGDDLYGVWSKNNKGQKTMDEYMDDCEHLGITPKFVCTYDSLPDVINRLKIYGVTDFTGWRLVVDELHILFNHYKLRKKAVQGVFKAVKDFKDTVWMTATPIPSGFLFKELRDIDVVEIDYPDTKPTIIRTQVRFLKTEIAKICKEYIDGKRFGNAHIFINSVRFISEVIEAAGLTPENTRAIVSTIRKGNKATMKNFPISEITSKAMKINFYSSTAFESCDIFDKDASMYVVTDGLNRNTTIDLSTTFVQILGRIRDCPLRTVEHYFTTSVYNGVTAEEFYLYSEDKAKRAKRYVEMYNNAIGKDKEVLLETAKNTTNELYYSIEDDVLTFDENLMNLEIVNYNCFKGDYSTKQNIAAKLIKAGFEVMDSEIEALSDEIKENPAKRTTFEQRYEEYARIVETDEDDQICKNERIEGLEAIDKYLNPAYNWLGTEKVKELGFSMKKVRDAVISKSYHNSFTKVIKMFGFSTGQRISYDVCQKRCAEITAELGMEKPIRIRDYYDVRQVPKRGKNDKKWENELQIVMVLDRSKAA